MLIKFGSIALLLGSGVGWLWAQEPASSGALSEPERAAVAAAGKMFAAQCAACHLPPDLTLATDRAWLHQLADTA